MRSAEARTVRTEHSQRPWEVFRVPTWLGLLTAIGLLSALFGDDVWDAVSWLALFAPIGVIVLYWRRRERAG